MESYRLKIGKFVETKILVLIYVKSTYVNCSHLLINNLMKNIISCASTCKKKLYSEIV